MQLTASLEAIQSTEASTDRWEQQELYDTAGESVYCKDGADLRRVHVESARKVEWQACVLLVGRLTRVVEECRQELVEGHRVEGEEGVCDDGDHYLRGKNFLHRRVRGASRLLRVACRAGLG